jgi:hypothetical protein
MISYNMPLTSLSISSYLMNYTRIECKSSSDKISYESDCERMIHPVLNALLKEIAEDA